MGVYMQALEGASPAVLRCGRAGSGLPLDKLDKYDQWKDLGLSFDAMGARQG